MNKRDKQVQEEGLLPDDPDDLLMLGANCGKTMQTSCLLLAQLLLLTRHNVDEPNVPRKTTQHREEQP